MASAPGGVAPHVLVVDDEPQMRAVIKRVLTRAGFEVDEADRAEEALAALERGEFDLLVIDLVLPGMPGWELVERLPADLPRVFVSGQAGTALIDHPTSLKEELMLEKPFDAETLLELASLALARGTGSGR